MERRGCGDRRRAVSARGPFHRRAAAGRVPPADQGGRAHAPGVRAWMPRRAPAPSRTSSPVAARSRWRLPSTTRSTRSDSVAPAGRCAAGGGPAGPRTRHRRDARPVSPAAARDRARAVRCGGARSPAARRRGAGESARPVAVPKVLYVSCNAASFARDARILADGGYRLERVAPDRPVPVVAPCRAVRRSSRAERFAAPTRSVEG